jgi:hypothetical protein
MSVPHQRFVQFGSRLSIGVSAALAAVFVLRASQSAAGTAALGGPGWTILYALIAVASFVRCFDRIVITAQGVTIFRGGIPRRFAAEQIHQLHLADKSANWSRLSAETVDGKQRAIAMERRSAQGQVRMRRLWDNAQAMLSPSFRPLTPDAAAAVARAQEVSTPTATRRCVRSGCPTYFAEVTATKCHTCGNPTQRVPT